MLYRTAERCWGAAGAASTVPLNYGTVALKLEYQTSRGKRQKDRPTRPGCPSLVV